LAFFMGLSPGQHRDATSPEAGEPYCPSPRQEEAEEVKDDLHGSETLKLFTPHFVESALHFPLQESLE
jgi:hypothetical protein